MKLLKTAVTTEYGKEYVECRFANSLDKAEATEFLRFRVEVPPDTDPSLRGKKPSAPARVREGLRLVEEMIAAEKDKLPPN